MRTRVLVTIGTILLLAAAARGLCPPGSSDDKSVLQSMTISKLEKAGDACRAVKDYPQAISYFEEAVHRDRQNAILDNKLGLAELKNNEMQAARTDFARAAKCNRKYPEPLNNSGAVTYLAKNYVVAAKFFKKAVALDETRSTFHVNLGAAWFAQNQMDRASPNTAAR